MATDNCAPCVFGAVSSTLLSFPYDIAETIDVTVIPRVTVYRNGTSATILETTTLTGETPLATTGAPGQPIFDVTDEAGRVWTTLGTTLTYPTTYAQYLGFEGAGVSPEITSCAQTLEPTPVSVPSGEPLSYVYPFDNTPQLPVELLNYLDANGVPEQLAGNQLTTCSPLPSISIVTPSATPASSTIAAAPTTAASEIVLSSSPTISSTVTSLPPIESSTTGPSSIIPTPTPASQSTSLTTFTTTSTSSTTLLSTTSLTFSATFETNLPPPKTFTTALETTIIASNVIQTPVPITRSAARIFNTFTGPPIVTSAATPLEVVVPTAGASTITTSSSPVLSDLFSLLFGSEIVAPQPLSTISAPSLLTWDRFSTLPVEQPNTAIELSVWTTQTALQGSPITGFSTASSSGFGNGSLTTTTTVVGTGTGTGGNGTTALPSVVPYTGDAPGVGKPGRVALFGVLGVIVLVV